MSREPRILQPHSGPVLGDHYLPATPATVMWGRLPCGADPAALVVRSGETVTFDTVSHEGILEDQGKDPTRFFSAHGIRPDQVLTDAIEIATELSRDPEIDGPHVITGPVHVDGAQPGDLLQISVLSLLPRVPYGVISNRHGKGALPAELPRSRQTVSVFSPVEQRSEGLVGLLPLEDDGGRVVEYPLAPFLGTMGVAVAGDERPHSVPPGEHGGNIDIKLLVEGTALYLPVQVPGALAYVGDPHFAQGDGEVALTALEAPLRATLRFDVIPRDVALSEFGDVTGPLGLTPDYLVPTGLDRDLNVAMRHCVRAALDLLQARFGMSEHLAYAYLSAATDFDISQVVDIVCGVHARVRQTDFAAVRPSAATNGGRSAACAAVPAGAEAFDRSVWRTVGDPLWQGAWEGPLGGLTVAVKDLFAIKGYRIGAGNPDYLDGARPESTTAPAVSELLHGGASLRGIARTDEFAYSIAGDNAHYGTPPNGAVVGALPGGSSSGPASAVASGQADIGLATDTAGSVRVPASYQGLWGLRTTHGLLPRQGMLPLAQSFDTVGWLTRDSETLLNVAQWCLGYSGSQSTERVLGDSGDDLPWRFAVLREAVEASEPTTQVAFDQVRAMLLAAPDAPEIVEVSIGDLTGFFEPFRIVQAAEAWRNNADWLRAHPHSVGTAVAARFHSASAITLDEENAARSRLAQLRKVIEDQVADRVLLLPTVPGPAPDRRADGPTIDRIRSATLRMTSPAAIAGLPALSVPLLTVSSPLGPAPVGVCLASRAGTDIALIRLARRLCDVLRPDRTE